MNHTIFPCIWFDKNAQEAAQFYTTVFEDATILSQNPMVTIMHINGCQFMLLNGGNTYSPNPAISYYVYCGSEEMVQNIYAKITEKGKILMALDSYDWSPKYAWVEDEYGVNWQLDVNDSSSEQKIVPSIMLSNEQFLKTKEIQQFYTSTFVPSEVLLEANYPAGSSVPEDALLFTQFRIKDMLLNAMSNSQPFEYSFTAGNSFVVECDFQEDIDFYWETLGENGSYQMCGWLTDSYGISWQIVPKILKQLMADENRAPRVIEAFLDMQKFNIQKLKDA